jgi:hypothetical protein
MNRLGRTLLLGLLVHQQLPLAVVQTDTPGDALSSLLIVRRAARTAGSPGQPDDHRPGEPPAPPEPVIDRLRAQIAAQAADDWRLLVLLADPHPADPPLPKTGIHERLLALAGDNAYVHMRRMGRHAHCCRASATLPDVTAVASATRYESPMSAMHASLHDRFHRVPASHFSRLLPAPTFQEAASLAAIQEALTAEPWTLSNFEKVCDAATGDVLDACRHLAMLVLRDAEWDSETMSAAGLLERIGTEPQRAAAASRADQRQWLTWNLLKLIGEDPALAIDPDYRLALIGNSRAVRTLLGARQVPLEPPVGWSRPPPKD